TAPQATRRWDDQIRGAENRELALREAACEVRSAQGDETTDAGALMALEHVAGHEASQTVSDDLYLLCTGRFAKSRDRTREPPSELLVVHPRCVREGGEIAKAPSAEEAAESVELDAVTQESMHEDDRRRMGFVAVDVPSRRDRQRSLGCESGERDEQQRAREAERPVGKRPRGERREQGPVGDRHWRGHARRRSKQDAGVKRRETARRRQEMTVPRVVARSPFVETARTRERRPFGKTS